MGQFHFDVPQSVGEWFGQSLWGDAYICGIEGVPWQSHSKFDGSRLTVSRAIASSGKLYLACPMPGLGYRTLNTCSLQPLDTPHNLPLELARGSCYRARSQSDIWERSGLTLSDRFKECLSAGSSLFLDAAQKRADPEGSAELAVKAIEMLEQAIIDLGESYAVQSISYRKQHEPQIGTLLASSVVPPSPASSTHASQFCAAFNSAAIRINWSDIETDSGRFDFDNVETTFQWCASNGLRVLAGPLIDFRSKLMPHWLYLLEDDFNGFLNAVAQFVQRVVSRFRGSVQLWNCAAGLNTPGPLDLDDEQVMRLAVTILQTVRRNDPKTPAIVSFDQPFGEYLAKHRDGISPMHFADALARSGLGMVGLGLDIRLNYRTDATLPRSAVDFGHMIDRWSTLGMPLLVQLSSPGEHGPDPGAAAPQETLRTRFDSPDLGSDQLRVVAPLIRTLLAKHIVHGIVWDGWSDAVPHTQSHSGLIDSRGTPRPLLEYLVRLRRDFLV
ncbi:glycoside hydrolase family 10 [Stieleria varia]|uniref:GH10 domain-containing protein n=2 Tax=Stieleria varia TaxID=2528005 RepID=A0A5C6ASF8_9BACT|nr:hypothetical protein Pla52n_36760 [Stieleria varia]